MLPGRGGDSSVLRRQDWRHDSTLMAGAGRTRRRGLGAGLAALCVLVVAGLPGCAATGPRSAVNADEQRLLPGIIQQQQERVRAAARTAGAARDEAMALRLRQRMLADAGRLDLAMGLEDAALAKEQEAQHLQRRLADEEAALQAYRAYAARANVRVAEAARRPVPSPGRR